MDCDIMHDQEELKMESILLIDSNKLTKDLMNSSTTSSLTSPVDSGVQMLDSESDLTSMMSASGYDLDGDKNDSEKLNEMFQDLIQNHEQMTQSDIVNQNTTKQEDVMNISLNSYELLDYTMANTKAQLKTLENLEDEMHVSMSEEVNEALKTSTISELPSLTADISEDKPIADEQIVFRRQRKKKQKSDTPKKRVSFHEDILNSTKIDDIHINHGFITIEPDVSTNFFLRGFTKKPDVVKGRYSWAAEGDAPYYDKKSNDRDVKSDIFVQRFNSVSSSSSGSMSSSIDEEEDDEKDDESEVRKEPDVAMKPKSSCLKKTSMRKVLDTNIVEEDVPRRKKSDSTSTLVGSLKNILSFTSSSVPLAERGVPEGQEDFNLTDESKAQPIKSMNLDLNKQNLKLRIEPAYQNVEANILVCDSNVYEHKGISYSYEYDNFHKTFESQKPKSSTIYQMILKEFNFFKKKAKQEDVVSNEDDFEIINPQASTPIKEIEPQMDCMSTKMDWSDDGETILSDYREASSSSSSKRHLDSPKRRINKPNHYAVIQNCEISKSLPNLRSSSKNSMINRFLRNVTMKKMLDMRLEKKLKLSKSFLNLYVPNAKANKDLCAKFDRQLTDEIRAFRRPKKAPWNTSLLSKLRAEVFLSEFEKLLNIEKVSSAYTTSGFQKALYFILTHQMIYLTSLNNSYAKHFVLPLVELNTIIIGPNGQTIHLANYDCDMKCIITTGCAELTSDVIVSLEMAMRKGMLRLPAVKQLNMRDMGNLRKAICKQTVVDKCEEYFYYSIVNFQEHNMEMNDTPLGPNKEGPLMFKISESESRWETAYFILKAGVLYMLSSPSHRVPMRVLPLINGACQGARRIYNCPRPHTFQLIVDNKNLHLAAPDEYVASEWLQALVHAASGTYNHKDKLLTQTCSLFLTNEHILTVREAFPCNIVQSKLGHDPIKGTQALSCACIADVVSFRLPSAEQSWCILEFACREVHETSGDWILYFTTNVELEHFISTFEMLWCYHNEGESFPLSTISEDDKVSVRCVDTYKKLLNSWQYIKL